MRKVDGEEILRRVADPRRDAHVRRPGGRGRHPRRGRRPPGAGRGDARAGTGSASSWPGAPPPSKTIERVQAELGWEFIQIYGLTETSPLLTINRARAEWDGLDGAERARLLSARRRARRSACSIRTDGDGEVLARSNHVFAGYWEQPEETATALADGWFHTGDGG